eukprot:2180602-Amphidinium_carterae.1
MPTLLCVLDDWPAVAIFLLQCVDSSSDSIKSNRLRSTTCRAPHLPVGRKRQLLLVQPGQDMPGALLLPAPVK